MLIPNKKAQDIVYGYDKNWEQISEKITGQRRWVTVFEGIYKHIPSGKFYRVNYERGSTEYQDGAELFYDEQIEFEEVELRQVVVSKWVGVEKSPNIEVPETPTPPSK